MTATQTLQDIVLELADNYNLPTLTFILSNLDHEARQEGTATDYLWLNPDLDNYHLDDFEFCSVQSTPGFKPVQINREQLKLLQQDMFVLEILAFRYQYPQLVDEFENWYLEELMDYIYTEFAETDEEE